MIFFALISVGLRGDAIGFAELSGKAIGILIVCLARNFGNAVSGFDQVACGPLKTETADALSHRFANNGTINAVIMIGRKTRDFCQSFKGEFPIQIIMDVSHNAPHFFLVDLFCHGVLKCFFLSYKYTIGQGALQLLLFLWIFWARYLVLQ